MNTPHRPPGEPVNRPVIELEDVVKRFGDVEAVDHVSLRIGQGEFFSLLGPSGCGKTTTLRMLAGFDSPTSGRILLDGADVTRVPANKRDVNMVFQNYALFPHLDVAANVAYGLRREKLPTTEIEERVTDVLELVDLPRQDFGNRRPTQLSGGQQQRVALARALVKRPKALLLDEPLGALDLKLRRGMQLELKAMQHELGITFIYVTHDQEEALTMSDRIAVMDGGRIVQVDEAREIYEHPRTRFVADFIGVSNIIELPVVSREGDLVALATPVDGSVAVSNQEVEERGRIAFSIRPEHIEVLPPGVRPDGPCFLEGRVRSSAYLGSEVQYQVEVADIGEILASSPASGTSRKPGEHVVLRWDVEAAIVLGDDA